MELFSFDSYFPFPASNFCFSIILVCMCDLCNEFEIEDARHLILKCPFFECERVSMLSEIDQSEDGSGTIFFENNVDMLYKILGRPNKNLNEEQMERIWSIILKYVPIMYKTNVKMKSGIG